MLRRSRLLAGNDLRILSRDALTPVVLVVMPVLVILLFRSAWQDATAADQLARGSGAEHVVVGTAVVFSFNVSGFLGFSFIREQTTGTWPRLRAVSSVGEILLGKSLGPFLLSVAQLAILLTFGVVGLGIRVRGSIVGLGLVALTWAVFITTLGLAMVAVARSANDVATFFSLAGLAFGSIGGAIIPPATMPGWLRAVAPTSPAYWAMKGLRAALLGGGGTGRDIGLALLILGAFAATATVLAVTRLATRERLAA